MEEVLGRFSEKDLYMGESVDFSELLCQGRRGEGGGFFLHPSERKDLLLFLKEKVGS